jgi:1,4-alpha-glucan branching enzyme
MKQIFTTLAALLSVYSLMAFNVTFRVDMNNETGFTTPEVNGSFNNWCGNCAPMTDANGDGIWELTIDLAAGNYQYKFSHDNWGGQEILTEGSTCTVTSFGFTNRSLVVSAATVLPIVCYGACTTCDLVIPSYPVTFRADMNGVTGFNLLQINGTFNGWCGACAPMSDANADGIYEITINLPQGTYEYKFATDNWNVAEPLVPGSPCTITTGEFTNRLINVTQATTLDAVCWGSCTPCGVVTENYDVTFRLDMNGVTGFTTPEVNGTFNAWCGNCNPMSDSDGDGIWETTISIPEGSYEFKYSYDNWAGQEMLVPGTICTITTDGFTNRSLEVSADMTLGVVCWESCIACEVAPVMYDVTFRVDMNDVSGFTTPEVNGTFNTWCGNCNPMSDSDGDGIWETTLSIPSGNHSFKYSFDNWADQEELMSGSPCTVTSDGFTNRSLNVSADMVLDVVCWESCNACDVVVEMFDVTFRVDMNGVTGFTTPEVNGTFNGWCGNCNPMSDDDGDGVWEATIALAAGSYEYKFAYDNWAGSEQLVAGSSCTVTNGGFTNRSLAVSAAMDMDAVCWASCIACGSVVETFDVIFRVDMNGVTGFTTPEVNGTFNGWCGACAPMSDVDGDGIWELTIPLEAGTYEFKYAYDNWTGSEQLANGLPCTINNNGFINRYLVVEGPTDLGTVCWATCGECGSGNTFNVTFTVDMNDVVDPFTTPEVNGTFNNWCGNCATMNDLDGDNVWILTIPLAPGTYEFKYSFDNWTGQENLAPGSPCTMTTGQFTNRVITVSEDMVLDEVCWASCSSCDNPTGPFNVTFKVNMGEYTGTFTTPEVNGVFNNWCGNCAAMTDVDSDNIWEITIPLSAGTYEYKFSHDNWTGQEVLTPGSTCTVSLDGFTNRTVTISGVTVLDPVCWGECLDCDDFVVENQTESIVVYPNPANTSLNVALGAQHQTTTIRLFNVTGQIVYEKTLTANGTQTIDTTTFVDGIYELQITTAEGSAHRKVMVRH